MLPNWVVTYVAEVPNGAHPSYAHDYYERDNAYYREWDAISKDRDAFGAWLAELREGCRRELDDRRDDERRGGAGAARRRLLLRRHRAAEQGREPRAPHARAGPRADLRGGRDRREADRLPMSIGDGILAETADAVVSVPEVFNYWLQPGRIEVGFLGAAQIDRFANINTTVIGPDYDNPKVRLPGAGGAPEIAGVVRRGRRDRAPDARARSSSGSTS